MDKDKKLNIGFISTRIAGTDGVSLESKKWITILKQNGHECFCFAGEIDYPVEKTFCIPEAHFNHERIKNIHDVCFNTITRDPHITNEIRELSSYLKSKLYEFADQFNIDLLIIQNAVTIPMNVPLGVAIAEYIAETGKPTIAHHHDFFWERERFRLNSIGDYLSMAFPPRLLPIRHVTINTLAAHELGLRKGQSSIIIPNVMDFNNPPPKPDDYTRNFRKDIGLEDGELLVLQPTRVVKRKRIELAINLIHNLERKASLVITHSSNDEGTKYAEWLHYFSERLGIRTIFVADLIGTSRGINSEGKRIYTLADIYDQADIVTFPSGNEGFGNAFLEAVYYKKPLVVNNYATYHTDIKPKGFKTIEIDGFVNRDTTDYVKNILDNEQMRNDMVQHNYDLAKKYFSYEVLNKKLQYLLEGFFE